jgi:hypothetical protein
MMNNFDEKMREHQAEWRRNNLTNQTPGIHNGKPYPFVLPRNVWQEGLWEGIREGSSNPLLAYLKDNKIHHHTGVHNLRSSWVLCANLYFPFREDKALMSGFLKKHICQLISKVDQIELEFAEKSPLDPKTLLGEPAGTRGTSQTSPDVAFIFTTTDDRKGIILTENKFVEHSFYSCSGRKPEYENPAPLRCFDFNKVDADRKNQCYQMHWQAKDRENRKYWDYIKFNTDAGLTLKKCPAAVAGYQLFRQQAIAEAFVRSQKYAIAVSSVAYDSRNEVLRRCLKSTGINDFTKDWSKLFDGQASFASFTHQQWISWVEKNDGSGRWKGWLDYVKRRYDF